jgi:hypothetical protein
MDTAMNNEPVAWMKEVEGGTMYTNYEYPGSIPLYTHTAKTLTEDTECQYCKQGCIRCDARKLLTDEEIYELFEGSYFPVNVKDSDLFFPRFDPIYFAKAILRKAQEK